MPDQNENSRRVKLLRDDVARKIAAGEVIDRPFSVVRELLDNAIDSGAASIKVDIKNGGVASIRVTDDGCGMSREDLELCYRAHATSKIETVEDLYSTLSMGFRGEALGSIGSCARLNIVSNDGSGAHRLEVREGELASLEPYRGQQGTSVTVEELFYNLPGRRRFLKSSQAEANLCRTTFLEKAAAFPEIGFQLLNDGAPKHSLTPGSAAERIALCYPSIFPATSVKSIRGEYDGFAFELIHASPSIYRRDRRYIHVYLNRRRIQEYSLLQAVEYGFSMLLPGGSFPVGMLFLTVDPDLVDFNIHPAKREARIKNLKEIHHALTTRIQQELAAGGTTLPRETERPSVWSGFDFDSPRAHKQPESSAPPAAAPARRPFSQPVYAAERPKAPVEAWKAVTPIPRPERGGADIRYLGQAFDLFLICQVGEELYLVDQHAAHERILYERFSAPGQSSQGLMVPLEQPVGDAVEERFYRTLLERLKPLGFKGEIVDGRMRIDSIPASYRGVEKELSRFLSEPRGSVENFLRDLYADMSCKAAVKDGEALERVSAEELLKQVFELPEPRCPHGRPVWFALSRSELFSLVGRT